MGPPGPVGPQGRRGFGVPTVAGPFVLSTWQTLALFVFVVFAFAIVSVRTEIQQNRIERNQVAIVTQAHEQDVDRWNSCVAAVPFVKKYNAGQRALAKVWAGSTPSNAALAKKLRATYLGFVIPERTVAQCGPKP
jgi:hypothetical protein